MECVVIGGGPAGRAAAMELSALDNDVTLVERNKIGGTCLNEGCMVVCGLNDIARFIGDGLQLKRRGVMDFEYELDYKRVARGVKSTISRIRHVTEKETEDAGVEIKYGEATVKDGRVHVDSDELYFDRLVIATGARPFIPQIEGADNGITYKEILELDETPEKLVIIGGGVIAAEFAGIFSAFGSDVYIVSRSEFLSDLDPEIKTYITEKLLDGVTIHENTSTELLDESGVKTSSGYIDGLPLFATGVVPNSRFLEGFVELDRRGAVVVNKKMETSRTGVYAAGDVTGGYGTTPVARLEGVVAALNAAGVEREIDYRYLPYALSLRYDVGFVNIPDHGEEYIEARMPGLAGPGSFWAVLDGKTGFSKVRLKEGEAKAVYSISPGSRISMAYLSLLMRLGVSMYEFESFIETHPSTDTVYKLMRFLSRY